jgi:hypothetical protein
MVWTGPGERTQNLNMKIDTNTPIERLCYLLRALADTTGVLPEDGVSLRECADRLEELKASNEDLWMQNHSNRISADVRWDEIQRLKEHIKRLEEAGDAMFIRSTRVGREIWTKAKEDKP